MATVSALKSLPINVPQNEPTYQIWICPQCKKPDDERPMIGCDECDDWYHWECVGISQESFDNQDWFCPKCVMRICCQNIRVYAVQDEDSGTIVRQELLNKSVSETPTPIRDTQTPVSMSELTPAFTSPPPLKSAPTPKPQIDPNCDYKPVTTSPVIEPTPVHLLKARFSGNSLVVTPTSNSNQGSNINGEDFNTTKETSTPVSKPELTPEPSFTTQPIFKAAPTPAVTTSAHGQPLHPANPVLNHSVLDYPVLDLPVLDRPLLDHPFLDRYELDHPVLFDGNGQPLNLASIPLPPSVASALESINERVAMRQKLNSDHDQNFEKKIVYEALESPDEVVNETNEVLPKHMER